MCICTYKKALCSLCERLLYIKIYCNFYFLHIFIPKKNSMYVCAMITIYYSKIKRNKCLEKIYFLSIHVGKRL